jgi:hypothetical protein
VCTHVYLLFYVPFFLLLCLLAISGDYLILIMDLLFFTFTQQKHIEGSDALLNITTPEMYDEVTRNVKASEGTRYPTDLKNGTTEIQIKDSYDDSELMRSVGSSQNNDENDESRLYVSRRDRSMYEDEYSVGRTRVRDVTIGNRTIRSASLSSRLRHKPSEIAL